MYDFPEAARALEELYAHVVWAADREGLSLPGSLEHPKALELHWAEPDLTLSQICGFEVIHQHYTLSVVATPSHETPHVSGPYYRSLVVVREEDPRNLEQLSGATLAINSWFSHSGCCALIPLVAPLAEGAEFFGRIVETGAHARSLDAVRDGGADVAAIDCISWAMLERHRPSAIAGVRILRETDRAPAPPYVSRLGPEDRRRLQSALLRVFEHPDTEALRSDLFIRGVTLTDERHYQPLREFVAAGARRSFAQLLHPSIRS